MLMTLIFTSYQSVNYKLNNGFRLFIESLILYVSPISRTNDPLTPLLHLTKLTDTNQNSVGYFTYIRISGLCCRPDLTLHIVCRYLCDISTKLPLWRIYSLFVLSLKVTLIHVFRENERPLWSRII
uniref:Uncharacterized protein n=1 Tax=Cacopsylla melanoneura TaxID=428564 RepID=A0A8D8R252_9HEMI